MLSILSIALQLSILLMLLMLSMLSITLQLLILSILLMLQRP
jgi:hypothetical protein